MATDPDGENVTMTRPSSSASYYSPIEEAMHYGRKHFGHHRATHLGEVQRLYTFILFLPPTGLADPDAGSQSDYLARMRRQVPFVYHRFLDADKMHQPLLEPMFQADFCARNQLARDPPLKVAVEVGIGGALRQIMKVRQIMKMKGNEWSQADELPVSTKMDLSELQTSMLICFVRTLSATFDPATDRYPTAASPSLPFDVHLSRQQRASYRGQSTYDDELWSCSLRGKSGSIGSRSRVSSSTL